MLHLCTLGTSGFWVTVCQLRLVALIGGALGNLVPGAVAKANLCARGLMLIMMTEFGRRLLNSTPLSRGLLTLCRTA